MRRIFLIAVLALAFAVPALAQSTIPQPVYFWGSTAAMLRGPGQTPLPLVIRPSRIFLFKDGSWDIEHLRWTGWGTSVAHATGISSASNGIPNQAQGKRIKTPASITLSKPGRFYGHEVYRCFALKVRPPASNLRGCLEGSGGYWFLGAPLPPPPPTEIEFRDLLIAGGCSLTRTRAVCLTYGPNPGQLATLTAKGVVTVCTQYGLSNKCGQGNFGIGTPNYKPGKTVRIGPFRCQVLTVGTKCVVASSGKGFLIEKTKTIRIK
jgi:hypothetical protein